MHPQRNVPRDQCSGETALVPGGLRGYRSWDMEIYGNPALHARGMYHEPDFLGLYSSMKSIPWDQPMIAGCYRTGCVCDTCASHRTSTHGPEMPAPVADCECGIYGWYTPGWVERAGTWWPKAGAVGVIEASGRVIMGTRGFRCEKARVVAVVPAYKAHLLETTIGVSGFLAEFDKITWRLAHHGIKVYEDWPTLLADYPPDDVSSLGIDVEVCTEGSDEHE